MLNLADALAPKLTALRRVRGELREQLQLHRARCKHTRKRSKSCATLGAYSPYGERVWTQQTCVDCGHRWSEEEKHNGHA